MRTPKEYRRDGATPGMSAPCRAPFANRRSRAPPAPAVPEPPPPGGVLDQFLLALVDEDEQDVRVVRYHGLSFRSKLTQASSGKGPTTSAPVTYLLPR
jgi:hypothetical protein